MSFKRYLLILAMIFSFISCSKYTKSNKQDEPVKQLGEKEVGCVKELPNQFKLYFKQESSDLLIGKSFDCINSSLYNFSKLTKGAHQNYYTPQELQKFFNNYLLTEEKIKDSFIAEIMKIKTVLVGGDVRRFTRAEIDRLSGLMSLAKTISLRHKNEVSYFLFNDQRAGQSLRDISDVELADIGSHLQLSVNEVLEKTEFKKTNYSMADLKSFIIELGVFLNQEAQFGKIKRYFTLVEYLKNLFLNDTSVDQSKPLSELQNQEILTWLSKALPLTVSYYYHIGKSEFADVRSWERVIQFAERGFVLLESSPLYLKNNAYSFAAIDNVINEFYVLHWKDLPFSKDVLKENYKKALYYFLDGRATVKTDPAKSTELSARHIGILKFEFQIWKMKQSFINSVLQNRLEVPLADIKEPVKKFPFADLIQNSGFSTDEESIKRIWDYWSELFLTKRPINWGLNNKVSVYYNVGNLKTSLRGLNTVNALHSVSRIVLRGYGKNETADIENYKISEKSLAQLEVDFKVAGKELKLLDPRNFSSSARLFKEGNFFTYSGNGNEQLDYLEINELLNLLVSGGFKTAKDLRLKLQADHCEIPGSKDVFEVPIAEASCFHKTFKKNVLQMMENAPMMDQFLLKIINSADQSAYNKFYDSVLAISRIDNPVATQVEYTEYRTMISIIQYIESMMVQFDVNQNQVLSDSEIDAAAPRFKDFIAQVSPVGNFLVGDIFRYMVIYGKKPDLITLPIYLTSKKANDVAAALGLPKPNDLPEGTRQSLLQVLGELKKDIANTQNMQK